MEEMKFIVEIINTVGTVGLLVWMVTTSRADLKAEQAAHELTRREYREDLRDMANLGVKKATNSD